MRGNTTSSYRPSSASSEHNNVDIDDLLEDLQQLSPSDTYKTKGSSSNSRTSGFPSSTGATAHELKFNQNITVNTKDGGVGSGGTSFFSNYPTASSTDSYLQSQPNRSNTYSNTNNNNQGFSSLQPHPPKNRSPVQINPKNKFAVLPENTSRGVSPVTLLDGSNNQNQSLNTLNYSSKTFSSNPSSPPDDLYQFSSGGNSNYSSSNNSTNNSSKNYQYKTAGELMNNNKGSSPMNYYNTSNSNGLFTSPPSNNRGLPEIEKSIAMNAQNKTRSARNSFDDKTFQNIFDELNLNDRPNDRPPTINQPNQTNYNNNSQLRSVSNDSWDEDSHDSKGKSHGFQIPKVKGSQSAITPAPSAILPSKLSSSSSTTPSSLTPLTSSGGKTRCSKVILAGTHLPRGVKSSAFSKVACDALLCSQCNFKVLSFPDSVWDASTDYMFLRNNMPNVEKLQVKLQYKEGSTAYCCQCQWCEEKEEKALTIGNLNEPKWICAGHSS